MAQPWHSLPNAALIDWVLQSLKDRPELWRAALTAVLDAAWESARIAAWWAAWDAARHVARHAAWGATLDAARAAGWNAAQNAAWCALAALVAYDDCSDYLAMTYNELRVRARLSETPQAVLLLSLKWVQEHEALVDTA